MRRTKRLTWQQTSNPDGVLPGRSKITTGRELAVS